MPSDALPFTPRDLAQMELKQTKKAQNSSSYISQVNFLKTAIIALIL